MTKKYISLEHAIRNAVRDQQYTKKPLNEDFEFEMARNELRTAIDAAKRLMTHLDGEGELEAWVQSKITKGADYLDTVADYMDSRDTKKLKEETEEIMEALGIVGGVFKGNQFTGGTPHIAPGSTKAAIGVSNDRRSAKETKSLTMHGKIMEGGARNTVLNGAAAGAMGTGLLAARYAPETFKKTITDVGNIASGAYNDIKKSASDTLDQYPEVKAIPKRIESGLGRIGNAVAERIPDSIKKPVSAAAQSIRDTFNSEKAVPSFDDISSNLNQKKQNLANIKTPKEIETEMNRLMDKGDTAGAERYSKEQAPLGSTVRSMQKKVNKENPDDLEDKMHGAHALASLASWTNPAILAARTGADSIGHAEQGNWTDAALNGVASVAKPLTTTASLFPIGKFKAPIKKAGSNITDTAFGAQQAKEIINGPDAPSPDKKPEKDIFTGNEPKPTGSVSVNPNFSWDGRVEPEKESGPVKNKKSLKETILSVRKEKLIEGEVIDAMKTLNPNKFKRPKGFEPDVKPNVKPKPDEPRTPGPDEPNPFEPNPKNPPDEAPTKPEPVEVPKKEPVEPAIEPERPIPIPPERPKENPKTEPSKTPEKKPEPKEPEPETEPAEPEPETKPSKPKKRPDEKPDTKTEPETEPQTEPKLEPKMDPKLDPELKPKTELKPELTPKVPAKTDIKTKEKTKIRIPFPIFGGSSSEPNYNWKSGHSNPWVIHRAQNRIKTEEVERKNIELVARKDEKKDRQNVGRFGKSQLTRQSAILQNRVDEEKKMAGIIKSVVKKKKEEKEGGPNPLVDFEPKLNHKYDNES